MKIDIEHARKWLGDKEETFASVLDELNKVDGFKRRQCELASLAVLDALIQKYRPPDTDIGIAWVIHGILKSAQPHHYEHFVTLISAHFIDGTYAQFDLSKRGFIIEPIKSADQYYHIYQNGHAQPQPSSLLILGRREILRMWDHSKKTITPLVAALLD